MSVLKVVEALSNGAMVVVAVLTRQEGTASQSCCIMPCCSFEHDLLKYRVSMIQLP